MNKKKIILITVLVASLLVVFGVSMTTSASSTNVSIFMDAFLSALGNIFKLFGIELIDSDGNFIVLSSKDWTTNIEEACACGGKENLLATGVTGENSHGFFTAVFDPDNIKSCWSLYGFSKNKNENGLFCQCALGVIQRLTN